MSDDMRRSSQFGTCFVWLALAIVMACSPDRVELISGVPSGGSGGQGGSAVGGDATGGGGAEASGGGGASSCETRLLSDDTRFPAGFAEQMLTQHNDKRVEYCLEPLVWDCELARVAQDFAAMGAGDLPHNDDRHTQYAELVGCTGNCPELGENIYWHQPWDFFPLSDPVQAWIDEENGSNCNEGGLHYTQLMWDTATRVGCGAWIDDNDGAKLHVVCNYVHLQTGSQAFPIENCSGCN